MALLTSSALSRLCCTRTSTFSFILAGPRHFGTSKHLTAKQQVVRIDLESGPSNFRDESHGVIKANHHWTIERVLSISMLPLYPAALVIDNQIMNWAVIVAVTLHGYWGMDGVLMDYLMERKYGRYPQYLFRYFWKIICLMSFAGFAMFNFNDIGFVPAVKRLWAIEA